jgi:hypothetical protein
MRITVEEQQKRFERARLKAYYERRKNRKKRQKHKQAGFKNMRLTKKSMSPEDRAAIQRYLSLRASRKKRISSAATPKRT